MVEVKLAPEYDWRISLRKGLFTAGKTLAGIAAAALLQYLTNETNVAALVKDFPALVAVAPLIAGAFTYLLNRSKHRE